MDQCECRTSGGNLAGLCIALGKAMHKKADQFLSPYGLTPSQFEVLAVLSETGAVPLRKVSECLSCACSNVTGLVDHLERDGLVRRKRSEQDRRVILLDLTDKGNKLWRTVARNGCYGIRVDTILDRQEESELRRILNKLMASVSEPGGRRAP